MLESESSATIKMDPLAELDRHAFARAKVKTGIGNLMDRFEAADADWEHLKSDDILQANWRSTHGKLLNKIHTIPCKHTAGYALPGVAELKKRVAGRAG